MGNKGKNKKNSSNPGRVTRSTPKGRADSNPNWRQSEPSASTGHRGGRDQPQNGGNRNFSSSQQSVDEPSVSARPKSNPKNSGEQSQVRLREKSQKTPFLMFRRFGRFHQCCQPGRFIDLSSYARFLKWADFLDPNGRF